MKLEKESIVTLDNNENYFIASTAVQDNMTYAYLINVNKEDDNMIVKEIFENNEISIEEIIDKNEKGKLALLLQNNMD